MANGGFFLTNLFGLLHPTSLSVKTPPELQAYGWTTADLWCAPAGTALYALLTHSQPFWADLHSVLSQFLGSSDPVKPLDQEYAKALCASLLATLFVGRTIKKFGLWEKMLPIKKGMKTSSNNSFANWASFNQSRRLRLNKRPIVSEANATCLMIYPDAYTIPQFKWSRIRIRTMLISHRSFRFGSIFVEMFSSLCCFLYSAHYDSIVDIKYIINCA